MRKPKDVTVPPVVAKELAARYRRWEVAERDVHAYQDAVADTLGVDKARVRGFDDERGVLLLGDPE